ncbi:MAG TPA: succinyldiaminopimelate transaminase [Burkholderiales bacterium]|nr:succinyldiaminopimelate transaminase [Burkholderiales bacterium]
MNPNLNRLQQYPFQRLANLLEGVSRRPDLTPIDLSIGEPRHATPQFIQEALTQNLSGLANYPVTRGGIELRQSIAAWLTRRFGLRQIDAESEILPVNGSREALFAIAQAVINTSAPEPVVVCPNPFYQIYEGATFLAGATPHYLNLLAENNFRLDFGWIDEPVWQRSQLVYVCSPGNPCGNVMKLDEWKELFRLADLYNFVIASDECYSELYPDEHRPPLGGLDAAQQLGRSGYPGLVVFNSLSKRSNVPGMRSGFVAGQRAIIEKFSLYRTYHGCAMSPPVQAASRAAWNDEAHVTENRRMYREKFAKVAPILQKFLPHLEVPEGGFYLWARTPIPDTEFAWLLYRDYNVAVLPGSYLAREAHGVNPGLNFVRIALVAPLAECVEAAQRIADFTEQL